LRRASENAAPRDFIRFSSDGRTGPPHTRKERISMAHGYLGDGYGKDGNRDPDGGRDDDRGGNWRGEQRSDWRDRDRSGEWRNEQRGAWADRDRDQDRNFMFDNDRDREPNRDQDWNRGPRDQHRDREDEGFFSRTADEARDWFRDDEHDYRQSGNRSGSSGGRGQSNWRPSSQAQRFGSHQDDHYLSWRQQQMDALDRDYEDYCRERQQQFHQDFSSWRSNRRSTGQGASQPQQDRQSDESAPELELTAQHVMDGTGGTSTDPGNAPQSTIGPDSGATLGTNNSENSTTGRAGRRPS
jgi:hypothetical protein